VKNSTKFNLGCVAIAVGGSIYFATLKKPEYVQHVSVRTSFEAPVQSKTMRRVYGHSLIPGGVVSIEDLKRQVQNSNRLTSLFAHFDWSRAQYCEVPKGLWYVSYWGPNGIKWTTHAKSYAGLACITDGTMTVLMRCGNLISWVPVEPTESNPPADIDDPIWVALAETPEYVPVTPGQPVVPQSGDTYVTNTPGGFYTGIVIPPSSGPIKTPEPSYTGLTGLLSAAFLWYKRRSR
jgi:hypothetical protein